MKLIQLGTPLSDQYGHVFVDCPSGFTMQNSAIISCGVTSSSFGPSQLVDPAYNEYSFGPLGWGILCSLGTQIGVSAYYNRPITEAGEPYYVYFRLVLMKIS